MFARFVPSPFGKGGFVSFSANHSAAFSAREDFIQDLRNDTRSMSMARSSVTIFMQQVYLWMTAALGVTAVTAYLTASSPALLGLFFGGGMLMPIILMVAIFGLVIYLSAAIHKLSAGAATGFFLLYSALMGFWLAPVLLVYSGASVARAFMVTAGMFGGMSVFGMVTKRDLSGMGSFLMMGLWGIILASIVNIFLKSTQMDFVISVVGVIVFTGLTAWDTQKLRQMGETAPIEDSVAIRRGAILGALSLYLDFINLFLMLLRLFGNRD